MSAKYSLLIIVMVALVLMINTLWLYEAGEPACVDCASSESDLRISE